MKKKFTKKLFLLLPLMSSLIIATPFVLTSCSSISTELVDKTIWKENGEKFAELSSSTTTNNLTFDIKSITKKALESDVGLKALSDNLYGKLALNWLEETIKDPEQKNIKKQYDEQLKNIDKEYSELYKSSKNSYGANFPLKYQQDVLDLNGGSESSWKEKRLTNYAKTEFSSKLFANNYLSITKKTVDTTDVIYYPNESQVLKAVTKTDGYDFGFNPKGKGESKVATKLDEEFAKFQQFIFDKWVEKVNPFVVNMSLWKYGTPIEGITSIYNSKATGNDDSATKNPGTYAFPYFSDINHSQNNGSTITKFKNFINDAKLLNENFLDKDTEKSKLGLRNIDVKKYTDDGSTLIFVKNGSIYNDLYIEFAAASSYLFGLTYNGSSVSDISNNWQKEIKVDTTANGFDAITQNFVSVDSATGSPYNNATNSNGIKIKNALFKQIVNDKGPLKDITNDVSSVDIIKPNASNKLSDFLFIRDEAGIHAVAIEGQKFITNGSSNITSSTQKAVNKKEAAERASRIVLYHYFLKKINDWNESVSQTLSIDILEEIKKFFEENTNYLVAEYMSSTSGGNPSQKLFNFSSEANSNDNYKTIYSNLGNYIFDLSTIDKVKEYNEKMLNQKTKYSNNYGDSTLKNGLASRWSYGKASGTNVFDVAKSIEMSTNPFQDNANGSYKKYIDSINTFVDSLNLQPLKSNFEGFKYSQYIYTNNNLINNVLLSYGSDGETMGNNIKIEILNKILDGYFDIKTLKFSKNLENTTESSLVTDLNHAFVNSYVTKTFDALTNKWVDYKDPTTNAGSNKTLTSNLDDYKIELFKKTLNSNNSNAIEEKVNTLITVATAKYLLDNNGEKFLNYLKSKISFGKDSYVAWLTSYNSELTKQPASKPYATNTPPKSEEVLKETNMQKNFNNTFESAYTVSGNTTAPTVDVSNNEVGNAVFGNTNDTKYYSFNDGKLGYLGLINDSTSITSEAVKKILFEAKSTTINTSNDTNQGLLFSYGSRNQLLSTIDGYEYQSQIDNLAEDLVKKVNKLDISSVKNVSEIATKKTNLKALVNDTSLIQDQMFTRKNTYVGKNDTSNNIDAIQEEDKPNIRSAAYVYQINVDDLTDWNKFKEVFKKTSTTPGQPFKQTTYAYDVIYNLLFDAAKETYLQEEAITSLLSQNNNKWKVNVYDVRLNQQLGPKWALNWKN